MYQVDTYLRIRQACLVDRKSQRQVSQDFNFKPSHSVKDADTL